MRPPSQQSPTRHARRAGAHREGRPRPRGRGGCPAGRHEPDAETHLDAGRAGEEAEAPRDDEPARSARKRGRRRGRGRGARGLEARLLAGSVLLLDPSVTSDATFQEHWQDAGALRVEVRADAIVLRRVAQAEPDGERAERSRSA